jgi:hypothetical protein
MLHGSMRHYPNGRKKKYNAWSKKKRSTPEFKELKVEPSFRRETPNYPSHEITPYSPEQDTSYKNRESKNFTVAPAYNKGAYQVIPKSDIKHIGK